MKRALAYLRVSTARQSASGLGLEAQRQVIQNFMKGGEWELVSEVIEVESGKKNDRPKLQEALHLCKLTGATLVVARLDRLSRDLSFVLSLQKAGTKFLAADLPEANELMIQVLSIIAQYERTLICDRTKKALAAAKERGTYFCARRNRMTLPIGATALQNLKPQDAEKGRKAALAATKTKADRFAADVAPIIHHYIKQGDNLSSTAVKLNEANILSPRKKQGAWTAQAVKNVLTRVLT